MLDDDHRFGGLVHPLLSMDVSGLPFGFVWATLWTRTPDETKMTRQEKTKKRRYAPIEQKERMRWLEGVRETRRVAEECPQTTCVCIADSEADIFELFIEPRHTSHSRPLELLVRVAQDRTLADRSDQHFSQGASNGNWLIAAG